MALYDKPLIIQAGKQLISGATFRQPGGHRMLEVGNAQGSIADVTVEDFDVDGTDMTTLMAGAIHVWPGSCLTMRRGKMNNASAAFIFAMGAGLALEDVAVGAFGLKAPVDAHLEAIFVKAGAFQATNVDIDLSACLGKTIANFTGGLYFEASSGPVIAEIDRLTIRGLAGLPCPASIQVSARPYPVNIWIKNSPLEKGSSTRIAITEAGGVVRVFDGGGNGFDHSIPKAVATSGLVASLMAERDMLAGKLAAVRQAAA